MNRLLEASGSCGATWGSPVPASLSPSMSLGHPVSCRRSRRHLPGTMLSSLEADPTSMVFWWTHSGVRHHVRLTAVRDASSHGSTARMSAAGSALLIPNHPGTQAYLGHPAAHRHSQCPWLQPGPRAAPQVPGSRAVPPGHCQLSADSELGLPHCIPPATYTSCHKHPLCSCIPHPQGCTGPESTSAAPCRAGKSWGA